MMTNVSPSEPVLRSARAIVFAVVCVVVSAGGHVLAGGARVAPAVMLAGAAGAGALAYALNGRERGRAVVLGATIAAQAALHDLFSLTAPIPDLHTGHGHTSVGMPLAHLTVAWLTGWWLHRGETAFWLLLRLWGTAPLALTRRLLTGAPEPPAPGRRTVPADRPMSCSPWDSTAAVHLRGPPANTTPAAAGVVR